MEHKYATVNGVKLHYVTEGKGQVILFLHGFPEFWYEWKNQLAEFGKDYQAVAPDMRGYNLSDRPAKVEDYTVPLLIEDIHAFLAKVSEGRKAILVAHDWGGALAWIYAAKYPETLDKLIIINAPHPTIFARELASNPKQQQASGYMTFFQRPDAEKTLSANTVVDAHEHHAVARKGAAIVPGRGTCRVVLVEATGNPHHDGKTV